MNEAAQAMPAWRWPSSTGVSARARRALIDRQQPNTLQGRAFRASFICVIMAMLGSFRCGRWGVSAA
jgi:hypothetical protein